VATIQGKVYADIAFMAKCLEHGLAGFPRIPHWVKALRDVQQNAVDFVDHAQIQRVIAGREVFSPEATAMPLALEQKIDL